MYTLDLVSFILKRVFYEGGFLHFWWHSIYQIFLLWVIFLVSYLRILFLIINPQDFFLDCFRCLNFTFMPTIHFKILLVQIMRLGLTFVVYLWMSTYSSSICWRLHFIHLIAFTSLLKIRWAFCVVLFLGSLICSTGFVPIPLPKPHFLNMENSKVNILNM